MIQPIEGVSVVASLMAAPIDPASTVREAVTHGNSFSELMLQGVKRANTNLVEAESMTRAFALGEDIPIHQVTFALEQARLSFELLAQVRNRLVESYQEILRMQV